MLDSNKRDLRKLFKLLKARRPLWDDQDEFYYNAKTTNRLWHEVFQEMNKKDSAVKNLCVQLRDLLRFKKPKKINQLRAYFNKASPNWHDLAYLKDVENLHSVSSLTVDDDTDSVCTVSTMTTDIDNDTYSESDLAIGDTAVDELTTSDLTFGEPAFGDSTYGGPDVGASGFSGPDVGASAFGGLAVGGSAFDGLADDNPTDSEWTLSETVYDDWIDGDFSDADWLDSDSNCTDCEKIDDDPCVHQQVDPSIMETSSHFHLHFEADEDFLLFYVHPRLSRMDPYTRSAAKKEILRALRKFEKPRKK